MPDRQLCQWKYRRLSQMRTIDKSATETSNSRLSITDRSGATYLDSKQDIRYINVVE